MGFNSGFKGLITVMLPWLRKQPTRCTI